MAEQTPGTSPGSPTPDPVQWPSQAASLATLKEHFMAELASITLAQEVQAYIDAWKINQKELARLLPGQSESSLSVLRKLLSYSDKVRSNLEGFSLTLPDLQALSRADDTHRLQLAEELKARTLAPGQLHTRAAKLESELSKPQNKAFESGSGGGQRLSEQSESLKKQTSALEPSKPSLNQSEPSLNQSKPSLNHSEPSLNLSETGNKPSKSKITAAPQYPLLRRSVSVVVQTMRVWGWPADLGEQWGGLVEAWVIRIRELLSGRAWMRTSFWGIFIAFAVYGAWHFQEVARPRVRHLWWLVTSSQGPASGGATGMGQQATGAPATPHLTDYRWISGHRLELHWTPSGKDCRYRIYLHSPNNKSVMWFEDTDVKTPGAIISVSNILGKSFLSVTAISPNEEESGHSELKEFDPAPENGISSLEPLPMQAAEVPQVAATGNKGTEAHGQPEKRAASTRPPIPTPTVPVPTEVHYQLTTPNLIRLTWRPVGPSYTYNVYSSATPQLTKLRKESPQPMKVNDVDWVPETGLDTYWVVVTALDAQGHESAYSEAIQVIRHPEKKDQSELLNQAAGAARKLLPW